VKDNQVDEPRTCLCQEAGSNGNDSSTYSTSTIERWTQVVQLFELYLHVVMSPFQGHLKLQEFKVLIPDQDLEDFKTLLSLFKIGPETFENTSGDPSYGLSHSWVV
jgi:hypothetical protein